MHPHHENRLRSHLQYCQSVHSYDKIILTEGRLQRGRYYWQLDIDVDLKPTNLNQFNTKRYLWLGKSSHTHGCRHGLHIEYRFNGHTIKPSSRTLVWRADICYELGGIWQAYGQAGLECSCPGERGADTNFISYERAKVEDARHRDSSLGDRCGE